MTTISLKNSSKGFTIVELLIAMTAFSSMIMIVGLTTLQLGRMYYKGVSTINTQEAARTVVATVSEQLQFANGNVSHTPPASVDPKIGAYCIGEIRYSYVINRRLDSSIGSPGYDGERFKHVLWQDVKRISDCTPADLTRDDPSSDGSGVDGKDLVGEDMRLTKFVIDETVLPTTTDIVKIDVGIIYGDNDLIEFSDAPLTYENPVGCLTGDVTAQWCAQSNITTNVFRRYPRSI